MISSSESAIEAELKTKGLNAPRLTPQSINDTITDAYYHRIPGTTVTVCALTLKNGYIVVGKSAAASAENFDQAIESAKYVLANLDANSVDAKNIIEKATTELKKAAAQKAEGLKNSLMNFSYDKQERIKETYAYGKQEINIKVDNKIKNGELKTVRVRPHRHGFESTLEKAQETKEIWEDLEGGEECTIVDSGGLCV